MVCRIGTNWATISEAVGPWAVLRDALIIMFELKQEPELSPADFKRYPVWISVHNYDSHESWYEASDEETVRPWTGPLPFSEERGIALGSAIFKLADGSTYTGFCRSVREDWDLPISPVGPHTRAVDEAKVTILSWSEIHGGDKLSILLLQCPIMFVDGRQFDFRLRIPKFRTQAIRSFYQAINKTPTEVFPIQFASNDGLLAGITSGRLDGFYDFPERVRGTTDYRKYESETGEGLFEGGKLRGHDSLLTSKTRLVASGDVETARIAGQTYSLTFDDLKRQPVWVRKPLHDDKKPLNAQCVFVPWLGQLPIEPQSLDGRVMATFVMHDGTELIGYVTPILESWADIAPPPVVVGSREIQVKPAKARYVNCASAIIEAQQPTIFVNEQKFQFWCGMKDCHDVSLQFYEALGKAHTDIFPIHFAAKEGLASGITSGEVLGFYRVLKVIGKPARIDVSI